MMWRDVINLLTDTTTENDMGDTITVPVKKQVFANKKSIRQSEFYQAQSNGLRAELGFEVRFSDYGEERKIEFNNKTYQVIRTFTKNDEIIELICQGVVNNATT